MMLPPLELPIEDKNAAEWWHVEFADQHRRTGDGAYEEAQQIAAQYLATHFEDPDDD